MGRQTSTLLATRVMMEYETGDFGQGGVYLGRLLELMHAVPPGANWEHGYPAMVIPVVARITGEIDRLETAQAAAETVLSSSTATPHISWWARIGLGLIAVLRSGVRAAEEQYGYLKMMTGVISRAIANDRLLGLLAQTMGNLDQATIHFDDALAFCRKAGYRPELAWTCCDYADLLLQRNNEGDRATATSLLDESLAISSDLGMRPLMERVLSQREILKA